MDEVETSERLTWQQIRERYEKRWINLVDVELAEGDVGVCLAARVVQGRRRYGDPLERSLRDRYGKIISCFVDGPLPWRFAGFISISLPIRTVSVEGLYEDDLRSPTFAVTASRDRATDRLLMERKR